MSSSSVFDELLPPIWELLLRDGLLVATGLCGLLCLLEFGAAGNAFVGGGAGGCVYAGCIELGRVAGSRKELP